jgi:hypothetical protein
VELQSGVATLASTAITSSKSTTPAAGASGANGTATATTLSGPVIPIPQTKPMRFEDPETVADAIGGLKPTQTQALVASNTSWRGIRVVGADYFNQILDQQDSVTGRAPAAVDIATTPPTP